MKTYKLLVSGWGMDASAHNLTSEEVQKLRDEKDSNGYDEFSEMYVDLPEILEGYDYHDTNWWVASRPYVNDRLTFTLQDEEDNVIWTKGWEELSDIYDLQDKYGDIPESEEVTQMIDAYPHIGHENILCMIEDVKGTLCNYIIESEEEPKPEDFAFTSQSLESPDFDYEVMDKMFYKNQELEKDYADEWVSGKSLEVYVFTLEDLESGNYYSDDDEDDDNKLEVEYQDYLRDRQDAEYPSEDSDNEEQ